MSDNNDEPPPKRVCRPRGSYRPYNMDLSIPVPRQTQRSRLLRQQQQETNQANQPNLSNADEAAAGAGLISDVENSSEDVAQNVDISMGNDEQHASAESIEPSEENGDERPRNSEAGAHGVMACSVVCECGQCPATRRNAPGAGGARHSANRYDWNAPLTTSPIPTTKFEAMLSILHLSLRHNMSGVEIEDIVKLVNTIVGCNTLPTSKVVFTNLFKPHSKLEYHFYCENCERYIGEKSLFPKDAKIVQCDVCDSDCNIYYTQDGGNFFINLSVKEQLEDIINRPEIIIMDHLNRDASVVSDVMDGQLYRDLCKPGQPLANPDALTICVSTDGANVYESNYYSLYPIHFICNEIDPTQRFQERNMMLAGLWVGRGSPNFSVFFRPFVKELQAMLYPGVQKKKADGETVNCPVVNLLSVSDSVARCKLMGLKQFGGHCSCPYGYHPCENRVYPCSYECIYRTHLEAAEDMVTAHILESKGLLTKSKDLWDDVNGFKGISPFLFVPFFHATFGHPLDYMHNLSGVVERLCSLFFDSTADKNYCIKSRIDEVDARLKGITPPNIFARPRPISDRGKYKCAEYEWLLLFYIMPCLEGILSEPYLDNVRNLVEGMHILLSESIPLDRLDYAEELFENFVTDFNRLYGNENMVFNIHLLSHAVEIVRQTGPLWGTSAYHFESNIGCLLKMVQGTTYAARQIAKKYCMTRSVPSYIVGMEVSDRIMLFCESVCSYTPLKTSDYFPDVEVNSLGLQQISHATPEEKAALSNADLPEMNVILYYNRVVQNRRLYYSKAYKKPKVYDDTCVVLTNGKYVVIEKIIEISNQLWAMVHPLRISRYETVTPHIKKCAHDRIAPLEIIPFANVLRKAVYIQIAENNSAYVCDIPNFIRHT